MGLFSFLSGKKVGQAIPVAAPPENVNITPPTPPALHHTLEDRGEIKIDPASLPDVGTTEKPHHTEYLAVKNSLLDSALEALSPKMQCTLRLQAIQDDGKAKALLLHIMRLFLIRYWDIPASRNNHHSYRWGLCLHSLDVANARAEEGSLWEPCSKFGLDELKKGQFKSAVILLHFTQGLLHDAHKLYQISLQSVRDNRTVRFHPHYASGNILDFKLSSPGEFIEEWEPLPGNPGRLNAFEFFMLLPKTIFREIPPEIFQGILASIFDLKTISADVESAVKDVVERSQADPVETLCAALQKLDDEKKLRSFCYDAGTKETLKK